MPRWDAAEYPNVRVTCRLRELRRYRRCADAPARVRRFPAEGRHGYRIWSEFGSNRGVGDRPEIAGGRGRSDEIDRDRPRSTDLRRSSLN